MTKLILATCLLLSGIATPALCADKAKSKNAMHEEITPAQREEMAVTHEKMAACLRSDKAIEDCHKEMMKSCKGMKGHCPMMGMEHMHGKMGKGMKHEHEDMEKEDSDDDK